MLLEKNHISVLLNVLALVQLVYENVSNFLPLNLYVLTKT